MTAQEYIDQRESDNYFRVFSIGDARERKLPGINKWQNGGYLIYDFRDPDNPVLLASDAMEPEDILFVRDLAWIAPLLNELCVREG